MSFSGAVYFYLFPRRRLSRHRIPGSDRQRSDEKKFHYGVGKIELFNGNPRFVVAKHVHLGFE